MNRLNLGALHAMFQWIGRAQTSSPRPISLGNCQLNWASVTNGLRRCALARACSRDIAASHIMQCSSEGSH
jgi:hypothetical protein